MTWIAITSLSDGIAVVVFAATLFLIFAGTVCLVRWIFRLITGRRDPAERERVILILENDPRVENEEPHTYMTFAFYLHSELAKKKIGQLADTSFEESQIFLSFTGPDAGQIWDSLDDGVREYSPTNPKRVILERIKKNGGSQILDEISWRPGRKLDFQIPSEAEIPGRWIWLSAIGRAATIAGIAGLCGWKVLRLCLDKSENEFVDTNLGFFLALLVCITLVSGLTLRLICSIRIRAISRAAGFSDVESATSRTLKYVLLIVIAIFGLIFLMI